MFEKPPVVPAGVADHGAGGIRGEVAGLVAAWKGAEPEEVGQFDVAGQEIVTLPSAQSALSR